VNDGAADLCEEARVVRGLVCRKEMLEMDFICGKGDCESSMMAVDKKVRPGKLESNKCELAMTNDCEELYGSMKLIFM